MQLGLQKVKCDDFLFVHLQIPVFQRGGTIIPKKENVRSSSLYMRNESLTLVVCLDSNQEAVGSLFMDDEQSFKYRQNEFFYKSIKFFNQSLSMFNRNAKAVFESDVEISRVIIAGLTDLPKSATLIEADDRQTKIDFQIERDNDLLIIEKLKIKVTDMWTIQLNAGMRATSSALLLGLFSFVLLFVLS